MKLKFIFLLILSIFSVTVLANDAKPMNEQQQEKALKELNEPLYRPLLERYVLDELKSLRQDQQKLREDTTKQITHTELSAADRALDYTNDTINNVMFIITATATILILVGWNSLRDVKNKVESIVNERVKSITEEYETRLGVLENQLKERSEEILNNQRKITITNEVHSLWMRANLESDVNSKIEIYDEILKRKPDDVEAITYKADALLEQGKTNKAVALCNQAIDEDADYGYAYWQRACAYAQENRLSESMDDLQMALKLSPNLKNELANELAFENLQVLPAFLKLLEDAGIKLSEQA
ncbi:TPR end-of-group domain-containing protein [Pseudoalteromonas sp. SSM20]|uniref:TPR end-of-group domain-containing protein n=1 Tax=unclassified Pseudoalteromonas TaxID=194690 RepID=UPI00237EC5D6|nr:tetratricopeptide repeat protein [Pseudoalteromonas sp. G4]MDE3270588.1 tetratricopeptide repeat protein [Pseudoalteromonas sp. G4]